ncbi:unnamed protein product [Rotaria sp. Silwood2]|nr:unnamed protein product [Rotaria sp. Silwood2]CAF2657890.1 unnamed protein product [Rotaria sp. Silwood2]CAF3066055.1 unnamed protein product [Rotaria sp. Silwood2]CAF3933964.1 unnamed protein product [Rotaria sp. Silwood2]CAF3960795.1 unnamed protein product [Rotaria sp. Silwood2]
MDKLPYELLFSIATHIDSPQDLCSFSRVSSLFLTVSRDDRIWERLCYQLYNIKFPLNEMKQSFFDLFTKILVRYGRYLGYWKSNEKYFGGLINVYLNISDGTIIGEKFQALNASLDVPHFFFDDDDDDNDEADESFLKPVYAKIKLFTIDCQSHQIFCHQCNTLHQELPWTKNFDSNQQYFGLSLEALPVNERSSLVSHDHHFMDSPEGRDIYFTRHCSDNSSIIYHPLSIPQPRIGENDHPLSRFNGLWVGSYGGHGLELLYFELCHEFTCPTTVDGISKDVEIVPNALVARKISGDPNVPHSKISFAATHAIETDSDSPKCYEGIGQIAHTNYIDAQFIRTKIIPISEDTLKVTWYALHHTSFFKRCLF